MTILGGETVTIKCSTEKILPEALRKIRAAILSDKILWPMYFFGQPGSGKTCAAACIARAWTGRYVAFLSIKRIVADYVSGRAPNAILYTLRDASLVILDDIGIRAPSDAQAEALLDILTARGERPMIITGNHGIVKLTKALGDERLSSRILSGAMIEFPERDKRFEQAKLFR